MVSRINHFKLSSSYAVLLFQMKVATVLKLCRNLLYVSSIIKSEFLMICLEVK